ncbi:MAG: ABC transporter ATP-binding protein [Ghiorsea sp.]|nr:ABC transporter ATP-binding protein [Ghiorsea sp.]
MIEIIQANKTYQHKHVLKDFSFSFEAQQAYALLGANGAGKSTLIKSMMGLIRLDDGLIQITSSCAYLPEQPYLPESMTPEQLIAFACNTHGLDTSHVNKLLQEVELKPSAWKQRIAKCSKGMKQRVAIAYVLAGNPDCYILDEPMSGLDVMGRSLVLDIFKRRHQAGAGIIMCSHSVADITKLCQQVLFLVGGELKETLPIQEASLEEADFLESRLKHWYGHEILD